ncbi:MAG: GGDEF domain-containing protein [Pseudomonadota bacterium]
MSMHTTDPHTTASAPAPAAQRMVSPMKLSTLHSLNSTFFSDAALFDAVTPDSVAHYLNGCEIQSVPAGEVLLTPDAANNRLFVLINGSLEVRLDSLERAPLTRLAPGECAGEMSMIEGRTPSAYVVAAEASHVLVISHDILWAMVGASHAIARNLLVILSGRLRSDNAIIADSAVIIRHFQKKSFTDALTGLNNRRWMEDFFTRELARAQINGQPAAFAVVDIDHFSAFNNQYGHLVGDLALGAVAESLIDHFRSDDLIARYGGDEFVVLLPGVSIDEARDIASRVRAGLHQASKKLATTVNNCPGVSVSIGLASLDDDDTLESLMAKADRALYRAKEKGRDQVSD